MNRITAIALIGIISITVIFFACGRTASRLGGKEHRQVLKVEHFKEFVSVSFDKRGNSAVKDVTFLAVDGFVYTREFIDISPFEGVIRWVPYGKGEDLFNPGRFPDGPGMLLIWSFRKTVIESLVLISGMCLKMNGLKI